MIEGDLVVQNCDFNTNSGYPFTNHILKKHVLLVEGADDVDPSTYYFKNCSFSGNKDLLIYPQNEVKITKTILFQNCTGVPLTEIRPTTGVACSPDLFVVKYE